MAEECENPLLREERKFDITPEDLEKLFNYDDIVNGKGTEALEVLHGTIGIMKSLKTSERSGISVDTDSISVREEKFGKNEQIIKQQKSFWRLIWDQFEDFILKILILSAIISLVIGIIQEPEDGWMEGAAILIAVLIVVMVTAVNDYLKQKQFSKLNAICETKAVNVRRSDETHTISIYDLMVGDILYLGTGDVIPVDGLLISGNECVVDQSNVTGESDPIRKRMFRAGDKGCDPFLISGSRVEEGNGRMLVCAVGKSSFQGKARVMIQCDEDEVTPLQSNLENIAEDIGKVGFVVALFTVIALTIHIMVDSFAFGEGWTANSWKQLVDAIIIGVTIIVVAVPEGLPLAVTISLAYSVGKMRHENNLVRHLHACESMGCANNICSDKTGTLTENRMTVVRLYLHGEMLSGKAIYETPSATTQRLLSHNVCLNSTACIGIDGNNQEILIGDRTECALIDMAKKMGYHYDTLRSTTDLIAQLPFSSTLKRMNTVVPGGQGVLCVLSKGAPEIMLNFCKRIQRSDNTVEPLSEVEKNRIQTEVINKMSEQELRCLVVAYKEISSEMSPHNLETGEIDREYLEQDLVLYACVGIEDPVREGVPESVAQAKTAGILVRMITGDNLSTAIAVAIKCGILPEDYVYSPNDMQVMLGEEFRKQVKTATVETEDSGKVITVENIEEFAYLVRDLVVLARSSPEDKFTLVNGLKQLGNVVAVTGDGTNDAPALKRSDVGLAMNLTGTDIAKEAADIILLDDNFNSIVVAVKWGRNIYDCIRKFLQFQLTVNLVALFLSFIGAVVVEKSPLTAVQMLWVNLIMDTFAALALATEPPTASILNRKPIGKEEYIVTPEMGLNILGACIYQVAWLSVILFVFPTLLNLTPGWTHGHWNEEKGIHFTIFFHTFVFMQLFNEINCRKLNANEINIFAGFFNNFLFLIILFITVVVQILMIQFGGYPLRCSSLNIYQHLICAGIGLGGLIWGVMFRSIAWNIYLCCRKTDKPHFDLLTEDIVLERCVLHPYTRDMVLKYHRWMQDPELLELTASEPVSLEEEYAVHESWNEDPTKLTYIILDSESWESDPVAAMIGDLNLFLLGEGEGDINIMIAEPQYRMRGIATEAIQFLERKARELGIHVIWAKIKIGNEPSTQLFSKLGYQYVQTITDFNEIHFSKRLSVDQ